MSVMLYHCMLCVALFMCLFVLCVACLTVFDSVCELFGESIRNVFGCSCYLVLLMNVMDVFSVCGGALLDIPCMVFQRVCVLCL